MQIDTFFATIFNDVLPSFATISHFFCNKKQARVPVFVLCAVAWGEDATAVDLVLRCLVQGVGFAVAVAPPSHLSTTTVRKFLEF